MEGSRRQHRNRAAYRMLGMFLMMPIGIMTALILTLYAVYHGFYFPGELFLLLIVGVVVLSTARLIFWRSVWNIRRSIPPGDRAAQILRERYAKGEISKQQFDEMMKDVLGP